MNFSVKNISDKSGIYFLSPKDLHLHKNEVNFALFEDIFNVYHYSVKTSVLSFFNYTLY